jgi:hypothetical protein
MRWKAVLHPATLDLTIGLGLCKPCLPSFSGCSAKQPGQWEFYVVQGLLHAAPRSVVLDVHTCRLGTAS